MLWRPSQLCVPVPGSSLKFPRPLVIRYLPPPMSESRRSRRPRGQARPASPTCCAVPRSADHGLGFSKTSLRTLAFIAAIEEADLVPSLVGGSSAGALVTGLYGRLAVPAGKIRDACLRCVTRRSLGPRPRPWDLGASSVDQRLALVCAARRAFCRC